MSAYKVTATALLGGASLLVSAPAQAAHHEGEKAAMTEAMPMPTVTVYHLEGRRSERIVWLMEELGLPYDLVFERGNLLGSMMKIREVNPGMPVAPTVTIGDEVLVESGAIIQTIIDRYAPGRLTPDVASPAYPKHLMWMHYAEGSLAARAIADYRVWMIQPPTQPSRLVDAHKAVQFAENHLAEHQWFGGDEFSAADIMMLFPLNFATVLNIVDAEDYPNVAEWRTRIERRPAYQRMLEKARPDGMIGNLPRLQRNDPSDQAEDQASGGSD
jgi:glutathione S-transferase